MKNIIEFIKDKAYYFLGGTVIIIIILIIVSSCSNKSSGGSSYEAIENSMTSAAKSYYDKKPNLLPKEEGGTVKVTVASLIDSELLSEIKDPKDSSKTCSGYVEVTKVGDEYSYLPLLTCKGNYEPDYLVNKVKESKVDEYGNGVYTVGSDLVYRGDAVNNYVSFNEQIWRIVKIDSAGDIMLLRYYTSEDYYPFDDAYNSEAGYQYGITTNFLKTRIKKVLNDYYEENFSKDSKAKIVSKSLCIGRYDSLSDSFSRQKECSIVRENEKVGLLNPSDYQTASLDAGCTTLESKECINYNYLAYSNINSWMLNTSSKNSYEVLYLSSMIGVTYASNEKSINPVIYISGKTLCSSGDGSADKPYKVK